MQRELAWLLAPPGGRVAACVGGMDPRREARALSEGAHVVVGTPGRLRDHLERGTLDLSALGTVVLDEADEMLDMGFREELEAILDTTPAPRRTVLFSATLPKPILELARRYTRDPARVAANPPAEAHADIEYRAHVVSPREREHAIVNVLRALDPPSALVFCATREAVQRSAASLSERGFEVVALSGELTQPERTRALKALRDGRARVLVATDVAARGLDLPGIALVLHADLPRDAQALQHRSGRTGRAGRKGLAVFLSGPAERFRLERMLRESGVAAAWSSGPLPRRDPRARRGAALAASSPRSPVEAGDEDREAARRLLAAHDPLLLAVALVRRERARLPAPEELPETARAAQEAPAARGPRTRAARSARGRRLVPPAARPRAEGGPEVDPAAALPPRGRHPRPDRQDRGAAARDALRGRAGGGRRVRGGRLSPRSPDARAASSRCAPRRTRRTPPPAARAGAARRPARAGALDGDRAGVVRAALTCGVPRPPDGARGRGAARMPGCARSRSRSSPPRSRRRLAPPSSSPPRPPPSPPPSPPRPPPSSSRLRPARRRSCPRCSSSSAPTTRAPASTSRSRATRSPTSASAARWTCTGRSSRARSCLRFVVFEVSVNPMPCLGLVVRDRARGFYDRAQLDRNTNLLRAVTAGFEEPWAASLFVGNVVDFYVRGRRDIDGKGYFGLVFSAGNWHIKDNVAIDDPWLEGELKLKGDRRSPVKKLSWSFRVGVKLHSNADVVDTAYLGIRRSRVDYAGGPLLLANSGVEYRFDAALDGTPLRHYFIVDKKWPFKKMAASIALGVLWDRGRSYLGALAVDTPERVQVLIRPNVEF